MEIFTESDIVVRSFPRPRKSADHRSMNARRWSADFWPCFSIFSKFCSNFSTADR